MISPCLTNVRRDECQHWSIVTRAHAPRQVIFEGSNELPVTLRLAMPDYKELQKKVRFDAPCLACLLI